MSEFDMSLPTDPRTASYLKQVLTPGITEEERNKIYDTFSNTYDEDGENIDYVAPFVAAEALSSLIGEKDRSNVVCLDIGAGTGLVGEAMKKVGFEIMDALDPSSGMLQKSEEKDVYRNLICDSVGLKPLEIPDNTYDIITVVGSHGHNHIKTEALHDMLRLVKPGGYVCIVTRMEVVNILEEYKNSFALLCELLESDGKWKRVDYSSCSYFKGTQGVKIIYQVC